MGNRSTTRYKLQLNRKGGAHEWAGRHFNRHWTYTDIRAVFQTHNQIEIVHGWSVPNNLRCVTYPIKDVR